MRAHRPVLVLTHASWEGPALVDVALASVPTIHRSIVDDASPELPDVRELGGLVVMGGPQDANGDDAHPGLAHERRLLADAVSADVPALGICLGMQLLAVALGAKLHLRHGREVGFHDVTFSDAAHVDPVLGPFVARGASRVLHWHSDAVELPSGAELLASTPRTPVQAFRIGSALGTQFHPEADDALVAAWTAHPSMIEGLATHEVAQIRDDGARLLPTLREAALAGFGAFVARVEARRAG